MNELLHILIPVALLRPFVKPIVRVFLGLVAIPIFRLFLRRVARIQELNDELEKDLEMWFRGSLLLLIATSNMEQTLFGSWVDEMALRSVLFQAGRLLLAVGVIEGMPDQALFALIYPGPRPPKIQKGRVIRSLIEYLPSLMKGVICQHLNRSTPVFAIMAVVWPATEPEVGWICYGLAVGQYLIIGLVASKDKALGVLQKFDDAINRQRAEIEQQLDMHDSARQNAAAKYENVEHVAGM